ncbi:MAG: gliding motility-associated C-terminal domain-containing protein, partial [Saprospiraceae bacterium]
PTIEADTLQHLTCSGLPAELDLQVPASVGFSFLWTTDSTGNIVSGQNTPKLKVSNPGVYSLLVVNGQNGCSSSVNIRVAEPDTPRITDLRLRNISCYGFEDGEVNAAFVQGGRSPYAFSLDGSDYVFAQTFRYLGPGVHTLAIESADGCRSDTTFELFQPNELQLDLGLDTSIHLGQSIQLWSVNLLNEPARAAQVFVQPAQLQAKLCDTCHFSPTNSFHYTVTVLDSAGCQAVDDRTVAVSKERFVFVPNVFRPDSGDNTNGSFNVFGGEDVALVKSLRVVNRWGSLVHERTDFLPNDGNASWDGKVNGQPANPAVFIWQAQILYKDGETEWRQGTVALVR